MEHTSFKQALEAKPRLGFCSMYPAPGIIERVGPDWEWCWIDAQHGQWALHDVVQAVRACDLTGIFSLVRAPGPEPSVLGTVLDTACHAVMVPMINTADQAEAVVRAARFAPQGLRSYGGRRVVDLYGRGYAQAARAQPLVVCQIETPEAMENLDSIAAVDGVDAVFFGPDDMALARGMPMDQPLPDGYFDQELAAIATAAKGHGKIAAGIFRSEPALRKALDLGYRLVVCGGDVVWLSQSANDARRYRALLEKIHAE